MRRAWRTVPFLLSAVLLTASTVVYAQYQPPHGEPGPAVDTVRFKQFAMEIAPAALENGEMDLYMFSLTTAAAKEVLGKPGVEVYQAPATSVAIVLNPAPAPPGELNPFSLRDVRFALQYVVNRDFVAGEIYKGLAVPMIAHVSPFDFDYLTVYDVIREFNLRYDPELAKKLVAAAMTEAGATLREGRWFYGDNPVSLKFVIRQEDERRLVGELVAEELRELGFSVAIVYHPFGPAIHKVYGTDPRVFEWHLYTEGWGKASTERYDYATINQMLAPWFGNMPGWQETGYWQYEHPELDVLSQRIYRGEFKDIQERNELYRRATAIGIRESVRLWVATVINSFPAQEGLEGVTRDLAAGPRGLWTLREAYMPDRPELTIGHLWVYPPGGGQAWNPVGGFTDVYSVDIWRNVHDPPMWRHPFTGLPMPFRVEYEVETAGPDGKLDVPGTAFRWDAEAKGWRRVGPGVQATSRVTFNYAKYIDSYWHHGQPITMADVLYAIYQTFDLTYDPFKSKIEVALATVSRPYLDTFRGFNMVNDTALEVYADYWHFIPDYIAEYMSPAGLSMPWEVLAAMDSLVFEKRQAAYSDTAAEKFRVPWLNLVMDKDSRLVKATLMEFLSNGVLPESVFTLGGRRLVSGEEAAERYKATISWFDAYKLMVISNGPFMLIRFDPASQYAELKAFRDPTYPFTPGKWYFGGPSLVEIAEVEGDSIPIGSEARLSVEVKGPGELGLKYLLFDPVRGELLKGGEAERVAPSSFVVELPTQLTSELKPGTYQLFLVAYSDQMSMVAERVELVEAATPPPEGITPQKPEEGPPPPPREERPEEGAPPPPEAVAPPADATIWLGGAAAAVIAAAAAFLFLRRRAVKRAGAM